MKTVWLYAASKALASQHDTLSLAYRSGFIWRSFYNVKKTPIACVKDIRPGDDLVLGYRSGGAVELLARFRIGRPDKPIEASGAFGRIPAVWVDEFRRHGYVDDPRLGALVGIFVEEGEPLSGQLTYANQNSLSRLASDTLPVICTGESLLNLQPVAPSPLFALVPAREPPPIATARDGIHIGIDVGGGRIKVLTFASRSG